MALTVSPTGNILLLTLNIHIHINQLLDALQLKIHPAERQVCAERVREAI